MNKKYLLSLLGMMMLVSCSGGNTNKNIIDENLLTKDAPRETYRNSFDKDKIPEYWDAYGCGDPYVLRYNGMYYLYVSTKVEEYGVMAWKSVDLINWELCSCEGLEPGFVTVDDDTYTAYAPEVTYFNGWFYMCESRRGKGHYILRSRSPEGPFVHYTDNFGEQIDGSFFIDDNEKIYFLRASNAGIRVNELDENQGMTIVANRQLENTQIGNWTEGPTLIKKDDIYYLTYTGTAVTSSGYRVAYSYHKDDEFNQSFFSSQAFTYGNLLTLNTSEEFNGLGHSSSVMGPNMDSYYIVYHNLVSVTGPYRHYNVSRLMFNGTEMSVNHPELENNIVPQMPDYYTFDGSTLVNDSAFKLSPESTKARFSAEFNAKGNEGKYVVSYVDNQNYNYLMMSESNNLSFHQVEKGLDKVIKEVKMNKSYDYSVNHTYRIAHDKGHLTVFFDTMKKMDIQLDNVLSAGKIGYLNVDEVGFTAYTNDAYDSSQRNDFKQDAALADTYDEDISKLSNKSFVTLDKEMDGNGYQGGHGIKLNKKEYATYKTYMSEDGYYGLDITVPASQMGKKIAVRIDNEEVKTYQIEKYDVDNDLIKVHLANFVADKGVHYISLYNAGEEVTFTKLNWYQTSSLKTTFTNDLSTYITKGATYVNSWKIKKGGHYALSGNRQLMYIGDDRLRNYTVEVDIEFDGETDATTAGILLRGSNPAFSTSDDVNSISGFYCGFNLTKVFITECNYNQTIIGTSDSIRFESGKPYRLKASCKGNKIELYIDGDLKLTYLTTMGPTHGKAAFYTNGAAAIYKNLNITTD